MKSFLTRELDYNMAQSVYPKVIRDNHKTLKRRHGRKHGRKFEKWGHHIVVSGNTAEQPTATKRHTEQDGRPDLHPETYHSHIGETRPHQCEHVVAKIRPIHKNDD